MKNSAEEYFDGLYKHTINTFKKKGYIQSQIQVLVNDKTNEKKILTVYYNTIGNTKDEENRINNSVERFIEDAKEKYENVLKVFMCEYSIEDDGCESIFVHIRSDEGMVIKVLNVVRKGTHVDDKGVICTDEIELIEEDVDM